MRYRPLGKTGLQVSEIGFGAWGIGGLTDGYTSYGKTDDAVSRDALAKAFDLGINFFDTSNVYGNGHSEELIGQVFQHRRDKLVLATKAGFTAYDRPTDFSATHLRRSLETSLRRLRTDYVDVLQLHNATIDELDDNPTILETLDGFKAEGRIRCYGISQRTPADAVRAVRDLGIQVVQVNLNMIDLRAWESGLLDLVPEVGAAVIARTPLCFGFLAGTVNADTPFGEGDHRLGWPAEQIAHWADGAQRLFDALPARNGQSKSQLALRFCLSFPGVSTVIPGMLAAQEVAENAAASDLGPLTAKDLATVAAVNRDLKFTGR